MITKLRANTAWLLTALLLLEGCVGAPMSDDGNGGSASRRQFPLDTLPTTTIKVRETNVRVWLATSDAQHAEGLMFVTEEEIADDQGMLFVFPEEAFRGFWMKNTITSLDIAFARADGTIVATHTMPPLTLNTYPSYEPAMYALEMKAGSLARLGVASGDKLEIPPQTSGASGAAP